jgi:Inositol polyphosphate kinase
VERIAREQPAVNAGGHGAVREAEPGWLRKATNATEADFYRRQRQAPGPLAPVIPASRDPQGGGPNEIEMRRLPGRMLDVKIGARTASKHELARQQGASSLGAWWKKRKMNFADWVTGSSERGYRVVGGTGIQGSRRELANHSDAHIHSLIANSANPAQAQQQMLAQLQQIRAAVAASTAGPIASSVLFGAGEAGVQAKLIDFAHTMEQAANETPKDARIRAKYQARFLAGIDSLHQQVAGQNHGGGR